MSISLKVFGLFLLVTVAMCDQHPYVRIGRYAETNENIDSNDLTPPQDPAVNTFPKAPVVPLIPTCVRSGYFRDPFNCGKFYHCTHSQAIPVTFHCVHGFIFNELTEMCDDPNFVSC